MVADTEAGPSSQVHYSIELPEGSLPPTTRDGQPMPTRSSLYSTLDLPLSRNYGSPMTSRETESEYLEALANSVDDLKVKLMSDMSAWKDAVGRFEDLEASRLDSGPFQARKDKSRGGQDQGQNGDENRGEEEDEEDEEDEDEE